MFTQMKLLDEDSCLDLTEQRQPSNKKNQKKKNHLGKKNNK